MKINFSEKIAKFNTLIIDWASLATAFLLILAITLGPIIFGLAIFAAAVKLCWYILFKL